MWNIKRYGKIKLKNPLLIEGLPGIGNVGKIAVDYLINEFKAKPYADISSFHMPASVVVDENGLLKMHSLKLSYVKSLGDDKIDVLFLHGNIQPIDDIGAYSFCDEVLKLLKSISVKEIITTGGIGLSAMPKKPNVYATSYDNKILKRYKKLYSKLKINMFGHVGPIVGVTGLLSAMAEDYSISSITLLADTFNEPFYFGIGSSKVLLDVIAKRIGVKINFTKITKEIESIEKEVYKKVTEIDNLSGDTSYIG